MVIVKGFHLIILRLIASFFYTPFSAGGRTPFGAVRISDGHHLKPNPIGRYHCCSSAGLVNVQKKEPKEKAVAEYHRSKDLSKLQITLARLPPL